MKHLFSNTSLLGKFNSMTSNFAQKVNTVANKVQSQITNVLGDSKGVSMVGKIIGVSVGLIVVAVIFPPALNQIADATIPSDMDAVETLFKTLLPILAIIGIVLYIYDQT